MQIHRSIILIIGLSVSSQLIGTVAAEPQKMHLSPNIKAAVSTKTRNTSPGEWPNPLITINDQTVTVSWGKHYDHYKNLQPDEVESFLVGLPRSAWPVRANHRSFRARCFEWRQGSRTIPQTVLGCD